MWIFLILTLALSNVECAKILGIFPVTARSHYILGSSLMKGLAEKGHDVTVISVYNDKETPKNINYKEIVLTGFAEKHDELIKQMGPFKKKFFHPLMMGPMLGMMFLKLTEETLNHTNVQKLINSKEKFDVVVIEEFANDALKGFASYFGAHLISFSTIGANLWTNEISGAPQPLSYVPDVMLGYSSDMTFCQRVINTLMYVERKLIDHFYIIPKHNQLIQKYFPNAPDLDDIRRNVSVILLNSHPTLHQPVPYVPNMIDIGGFHVKPPKKLPNDLQNLLDGAKNGIIYFSFGSNMKSSLMPPEKRQIFIDAFSKLKQTVIWKWEEDELPGKPDNVIIAKWLPQQDILAHPNVKLFITHGGLLSTMEVIYHGLPVLVVPLGGDQNLNAQKIVNQGIGLQQNFHELTADVFLETINKLLDDPTYSKNAKERSKLYHDRVVSPLDTAVYWVEYVIRHGGAKHLKVAGLDLPWYQYYLLDVIAVLTIGSLVLLHINLKIGKRVLRSCFGKKKQKVKKH